MVFGALVDMVIYCLWAVMEDNTSCALKCLLFKWLKSIGLCPFQTFFFPFIVSWLVTVDLEIEILVVNDNWCFYCGYLRLHFCGSN